MGFEENLKLVHYVIRKYFLKNIEVRGYEYDDVFQEGSIGLLKAIKSYNKNRGVKFSTYAVKVIYYTINDFFKSDKWFIGTNEDRLNGTCRHQISISSDELSIEDTLIDLTNVEDVVISQIMFEKLLEKLNSIERFLIYERFYNRKTQREVADEIGTYSRKVSRMEKEVLDKLECEIKWLSC